MFELVAAVLFAVVVSGLCSVFEAVLYSVPNAHIESLIQENRRSGRLMRRFRENIDRPIAGILSLNTIANTAGAAVAGAAASRVFGAESVVMFSVFFTLTILFFSEVIPKTAGVVYCRPLTVLVAYPIRFIVLVMAPIIWLSRLATRVVSRGSEVNTFSEQELLSMVRMGLKSGTLEVGEAQAITNILSLENKRVSDIMTPRTVLFTLSAHTTMGDLRDNAPSWVHSRAPVYDKNPEDIVGLVLRRDVLLAIAADRWDVTIGDLMRPVDFVVQIHPLDRLLSRFLQRGQHLLVVLDELGELTGVVTLEDLMEEILGEEIIDEFDTVADLREIAHRRRERTLKRPRPGEAG